MKDTNRINEVETLERKWRTVQVGLNNMHVLQRRRISSCDLHRGTEIDGPYLARILPCIVCEPPVAASGIQNFLPFEKTCVMRLHVIKKLFLPLRIHFGKALPFITKAQRGLCLFSV